MTSIVRGPRWSTAVVTLLAALALLVAACGGDDGSADGDTTTDPGASESDADSTPSSDGSDDAESADNTDDTPSTEMDADAAESDDTESDDTGDDGAAGGDADVEKLFPDVVGATAQHDGSGSWTFSATLSSPYDTPARYADAWRVVGPDGEVYGVRELTHDHANEQPFTRSQSGILIPEEVATVTVEGRDQISGWGGATVEVTLER